MRSLAETVLRYRVVAVLVWVLLVGAAAVFALRLNGVLQGGAEPIPGSASERVNDLIQEAFGPGSLYQYLVVLESSEVAIYHADFRTAAQRVADALTAVEELREVRTYWNFGLPELKGKNDTATLMLVTPTVANHHAAELLTRDVRAAIASVELPAGFSAWVTSMSAMFYDLDEHSSSDLIAAERIGLPITLLILLAVFGAPVAAALPLLLAIASVTVSLAGLYFLSAWTPVSLFAENAVSMIGLGVGTDYALFIVSRFRQELAGGADFAEAIARGVVEAGHAVLFSGLTVALGFLGLFLTNAPVLHSIALGGIVVVATAVAASLTLLPALLSLLGQRTNWPRGFARAQGEERPGAWSRWAMLVMGRPWLFLIVGLAVLAVFIAPIRRLQSWNIGAKDLTPELESRKAYDVLAAQFETGWMGPTVLVVQAAPGRTLWDQGAENAVLAINDRLAKDERISQIGGFAGLLTSLRLLRTPAHAVEELPESLRPFASPAITADGKTALVLLFPRREAESREAMALVRDLRADLWPEATAMGLRVHVGGWTAIRADLDAELFGSLRRIVPAVLVSTFLILLVLFRSIVIPLKATALNLLSVLAAYGFLVYVFQDGLGARWIGLVPPGGLNPFIVVALFTILFGLSMDYEVFLLTRMREEYLASRDNVRAVSAGLEATAGIITSAALIMVSIFTAFGFTNLVVTRQFGLGLAFAVALDATVLRTLVAPALMALAGDLNWSFSRPSRRDAANSRDR
jgi:putative drug exporter of the RND superfamily